MSATAETCVVCEGDGRSDEMTRYDSGYVCATCNEIVMAAAEIASQITTESKHD